MDHFKDLLRFYVALQCKDDCMQALKIALPGYILPYFPKESVTKFLQQKVKLD